MTTVVLRSNRVCEQSLRACEGAEIAISRWVSLDGAKLHFSKMRGLCFVCGVGKHRLCDTFDSVTSQTRRRTGGGARFRTGICSTSRAVDTRSARMRLSVSFHRIATFWRVSFSQNQVMNRFSAERGSYARAFSYGKRVFVASPASWSRLLLIDRLIPL